jgi:hypothetical protein
MEPSENVNENLHKDTEMKFLKNENNSETESSKINEDTRQNEINKNKEDNNNNKDGVTEGGVTENVDNAKNNNNNNDKGSLIDDFASFDTEMPDYF